MKTKRHKRLVRLVRKLVEGRIGHRVILLSMEVLPSCVWGKEGYAVRYIDTRTLFEKKIFFPSGGKEYVLIKDINPFDGVYWLREKRIFVRTKQVLPNGYCVKRAVRV